MQQSNKYNKAPTINFDNEDKNPQLAAMENWSV